MTLCPQKVSYPSLTAALDTLIKSFDPPGFGYKLLRVYKCPYCTGWHTTSHPRDIRHRTRDLNTAKRMLRPGWVWKQNWTHK